MDRSVFAKMTTVNCRNAVVVICFYAISELLYYLR